VGGLGHYLEQEGIPTTQISLVREHTELIRPPRALWVPFDLGRPFGAPDEPTFQRRVLRAALDLFACDSGPVLSDFPDDAPEAGEIEGWACPVNLPAPPADSGDRARLLADEVRATRPWHDLWRERNGRSTVGVSGLDIEAAAAFMAAFLTTAHPPLAREGVSASALLKLAVEDVKAFYLEAAMAQPGAASHKAIADWFWGGTVAARVMLALRPLLTGHEDAEIRRVALGALVPQTQLWRLDA
jgi:hypothetical protein